MNITFTKIFGRDWRTLLSQVGVALTSAITVLAALPYQLGDVANIIPPAWKAKVVVGGIISSFILRVINGANQKDNTK